MQRHADRPMPPSSVWQCVAGHHREGGGRQVGGTRRGRLGGGDSSGRPHCKLFRLLCTRQLPGVGTVQLGTLPMMPYYSCSYSYSVLFLYRRRPVEFDETGWPRQSGDQFTVEKDKASARQRSTAQRSVAQRSAAQHGTINPSY